MTEMKSGDILKRLDDFVQNMVLGKEFVTKSKPEMDMLTSPKMLSALVDRYQSKLTRFVTDLGESCESREAIQHLISLADPKVLVSFYTSYDVIRTALLSHMPNQKWKISEDMPEFLEDLFIGYLNDIRFLPND